MKPVMKRTKGQRIVVEQDTRGHRSTGAYLVITYGEAAGDTEVSTFSTKKEAFTMAGDLALMFPAMSVYVGRVIAEVYAVGEGE